MTPRTSAPKAVRAPSFFPTLPFFSQPGHARFAESAKLEHLSAVALAKVEAIKANLRGLGYGG
jgi:hypothetical protein